MRPVFLAFTAVIILGATACSDDPKSSADTLEVDDTTAETSEVDTGPISRPTVLNFTFNGMSDTFRVNATATFNTSFRRYELMAQRSERSMQFIIEPTELGAKETWNETSSANGRVTICFNNGGTAGEFVDCEDGTVYTSKEYTVTITGNDGPGGYIDGTFTATMIDRFNDEFPISGDFVFLHR